MRNSESRGRVEPCAASAAAGRTSSDSTETTGAPVSSAAARVSDCSEIRRSVTRSPLAPGRWIETPDQVNGTIPDGASPSSAAACSAASSSAGCSS
jgi:hypothetical protein